MPRPITYIQLREKVKDMYGTDVNMFFTQANGEVSIKYSFTEKIFTKSTKCLYEDYNMGNTENHCHWTRV